MSYKLIMLDFDGTLCATHNAIVYSVQQVYKSYTVPLPDQQAIERVIHRGLGMQHALQTLSPSLDEQRIRTLLEAYEQNYLEEGALKSTTFPHAHTVLKQLQDAGLILTIVSNKAVQAVSSSLERFGLKQYIKMIVGDRLNMKKKPDPMAYTTVIKPTFPELSVSEILMVGDTQADLLFAKNIGVDACWAQYGYGTPAECIKLNPQYRIHDLLDLLPIIIPNRQPPEQHA